MTLRALVNPLLISVILAFLFGAGIGGWQVYDHGYLSLGLYRIGASTVIERINIWLVAGMPVLVGVWLGGRLLNRMGRSLRWPSLQSYVSRNTRSLFTPPDLGALVAFVMIAASTGWVANRYWLPNRFDLISLAGDVLIMLGSGVAVWTIRSLWKYIDGFGTRKFATLVSVIFVVTLGANTAFVLDRFLLAPQRSINLVWIVIDALRADHLTFHGYSRETSPFLDELSLEYAVFLNAISQESYTQASVPSYFTSVYPFEHHCLYDRPRVDVLSNHFTTIAEFLRNENFQTAAFVFNPHLKARFNFNQGFDLYDDNEDGFDLSLAPHESFETARKIHRKVNKWLKQTPRRPVFLYLHYRDVHSPYVPPPPYHLLWRPSQYALHEDILFGNESNFETPEHLALMVSEYDGEIRYTDDALRRLFTMLENNGLNHDNTVFVVTSDHGEEFLDPHPHKEGGWYHGRTLHRELIHVPLLLWLPGQTYPNLKIRDHVELTDIVPTLLDFLAIEPSTHIKIEGKSLLPLLQGRKRPVSQVLVGGNNGRACVIIDMFKLCRDGQDPFNRRIDHETPRIHSYELYDLRSDPNETVDLSQKYPAIMTRLQAILDEAIDSSTVASGAKSVAIDATTEEQLKALGYVEPG